MASLSFDSLGLTYAGIERRIEALSDITLSLPEGEAVSVIGPSGCGKSTLLLAAAGLLRPTAGRVLVDGRQLSGVRRTTALILQDFGLFPWKTVFHNAALGLEIRGHRRAELRERVMNALDQVGIAEFARAFPGELSGGMRQRLALARALALDADVLLMDEPLSALDALTREDMQDVLLDLWLRRRHTSVLVTHSIAEAVYLGRRVVVLTPRPGRIAAVVDNPGVGEPGFRDSRVFHLQVVELRRLLAEEGAIHAGASAADSGERTYVNAAGIEASGIDNATPPDGGPR
jgi:NitT/TauT family transport system ATP-binding protein